MRHPYRHVLMAFLLLGLSESSFAQRTYVEVEAGEMLDSVGYAAFKDRIVGALQTSVHPYFHIAQETFQEVRRNRDSIIVRVKLRFENNRPPGDSLSTKPSRLQVGDTFPAMKVRGLSGQPVDLGGMGGKPTLINFWFIACPPCLEEMPALGDIRRKLGDSVHFVAVTFEKPEAVYTFLQRQAFPFLHVPDAWGLIERVGVRTYPVNVFLDRHRVVRRIENGIPAEWREQGRLTSGSGEEFARFLRGLMGGD